MDCVLNPCCYKGYEKEHESNKKPSLTFKSKSDRASGFQIHNLRAALVLLFLSSVSCNMVSEKCQFTKNELLSMKMEVAFQILMQFYEDRCSTIQMNSYERFHSSVVHGGGDLYMTHGYTGTEKYYHIEGKDNRKEVMNDQFEILSNFFYKFNGKNWKNQFGWSDTNTPICMWNGIQCSTSCSYYEYFDNSCPVIGLNVFDNNISGNIEYLAVLGDLPYLELIDFSGNYIYGNLSDLRLPNILYLKLPWNEIEGSIPDFQGMPNLMFLNLDGNHLDGTIPNFSGFPTLSHLSLVVSTELQGNLPNFSDMPVLQYLLIVATKINGPIPDFSYMPNVILLILYVNELSGSVPDFSRIYNLELLALAMNNLEGQIPNFSNIPNVFGIFLQGNQLTGDVPVFDKASILGMIDVSNNILNGTIPKFESKLLNSIKANSNKIIGSVPDFLQSPSIGTIELGQNNLNGSSFSSTYLQERWNIPDFDCTPRLMFLILKGNNLTGTIPEFNLNPFLTVINLSDNGFYGTIPQFSGFMFFNEINFEKNKLNGSLPLFYNTPYVRSVNFGYNKLTGTVPQFDLMLSDEIIFSNNLLNGTIPDFQNFVGLEYFDISHNQLSGTVPEFSFLGSLKFLNLNNNQLSGLSDLNVPSLLILNIAKNRLLGPFPALSKCESLIRIDAHMNEITLIGFEYLPMLQAFDFSFNNLTGRCLADYGIEFLTEINLSFNNLTDPLPDWIYLKSLKKLDLFGNKYLRSPLPSGMSGFYNLETLSILGTNMSFHPNRELLPAVLEFTGTYQLEKLDDGYQCPVVRNRHIGHSMIEINSTYYDRIMCKCLPGYFGLGENCVRCPSECYCPNGKSLLNCYASPNVKEVEFLLQCPRLSSCKTVISDVVGDAVVAPTVSKECEKGYESHACSKCQNGYGIQGRSCIKCDDSGIYAALIFGITGLLLLITYLYRFEASTSAKLRIVMFHLQTLSIVTSGVFQSDDTNNFINISSSIGSIQLPNISCILNSTDILEPFLFNIMRIPLFIIIGILPHYFGNEGLKKKATYATIYLLFFIYYSIGRDVFGVFGCTVYDSGQKVWYLNNAPWIQCSPLSPHYKDLLSISIFVFVFFVIGLPVLVFWKLKTVLYKSKEDAEAQYGFLYLPYKEEFKFWEFVIIVRRISFSFAVSVIPYTSPTIHYLLLVIVIQTSIWIQKELSPYKSPFENKMELSSLYLIFVSFFLALLSTLLGSDVWITGLLIALNVGWLVTTFFIAFAMPYLKKLHNLNRVQEIPRDEAAEIGAFNPE